MDALDAGKYDIVQLGIRRAGEWLTGDAWKTLRARADSCDGEQSRSDASPSKPETSPWAEDVMRQIVSLDVIFPVLHGTYGEDGTVQGLLELVDVPYVGSGVLGSAVCMDKAMFKHVMRANGIAVVPWQLVERGQFQKQSGREETTSQSSCPSPSPLPEGEGTADDAVSSQAQTDEIVCAVEAALSYPVFTKPANLGSSIGISKCHDRQQLVQGLNEAARYDRRLVVEQAIRCRELEVAVIGNEDPRASVVGEIRSQGSFYDYSAKYLRSDSELVIPAPLDDAVAESVRGLAVKAYRATDCAGLARVDFFLDDETGVVYVNEINTMPGFTSMSMFPKLWDATGVGYAELLDELIGLAVDRFHGRD